MKPHEREAAYGALGHDEQHVADMLIDRLRLGQQRYGELRTMVDQRDFHAEALEEILDFAVYLAVAVMRLGTERQPGADTAEHEALAEGTGPTNGERK